MPYPNLYPIRPRPGPEPVPAPDGALPAPVGARQWNVDGRPAHELRDWHS